MNKPIRQYDPSRPPDSTAYPDDDSGASGSGASGNQGLGLGEEEGSFPDEYDEGGTTGDGAEGESGLPGPVRNVGGLTGTNRDETGPDENMATDS